MYKKEIYLTRDSGINYVCFWPSKPQNSSGIWGVSRRATDGLLHTMDYDEFARLFDIELKQGQIVKLCITTSGPTQSAIETEPEIEWWVSSEHLLRSGPHKTQVAAWEALRATPEVQAKYGIIHVPGACVWPERTKEQNNG